MLADPPPVCRLLWMTRSLSQCPTLSTSCLTLAGQCPLVTQVQVSAGAWERVGVGVGFAFPRVPDAWPDAQLPCSAPAGPFPAPPPPQRPGLWQGLLHSGEVWLACGPASLSAQLPLPGLGRGFVRPPSLVSFLSFLFLVGCVLLGMFLFLIFLPFLLAPLCPLLSSPCALLPPLNPASLFSPSPPPADLLEI